jgi:hypothetical protein
MNQEEVDITLATWKILCGLRKGSNIVSNDPLFAPRPTIPKEPERQRTLHVRFGWEWLEVGTECNFTGGIRYRRYQGELYSIDFEIEYYIDTRLWKSFWKETQVRRTMWSSDEHFEDKYPHSKNSEDVTYECES